MAPLRAAIGPDEQHGFDTLILSSTIAAINRIDQASRCSSGPLGIKKASPNAKETIWRKNINACIKSVVRQKEIDSTRVEKTYFIRFKSKRKEVTRKKIMIHQAERSQDRMAPTNTGRRTIYELPMRGAFSYL